MNTISTEAAVPKAEAGNGIKTTNHLPSPLKDGITLVCSTQTDARNKLKTHKLLTSSKIGLFLPRSLFNNRYLSFLKLIISELFAETRLGYYNRFVGVS